KALRLIEPEEFDRLLQAWGSNGEDGEQQGWACARNRTILCVLLDTGIRVNELCALRLEEVDRQAGRLRIGGEPVQGTAPPTFGSGVATTLSLPGSVPLPEHIRHSRACWGNLPLPDRDVPSVHEKRPHAALCSPAPAPRPAPRRSVYDFPPLAGGGVFEIGNKQAEKSTFQASVCCQSRLCTDVLTDFWEPTREIPHLSSCLSLMAEATLLA